MSPTEQTAYRVQPILLFVVRKQETHHEGTSCNAILGRGARFGDSGICRRHYDRYPADRFPLASLASSPPSPLDLAGTLGPGEVAGSRESHRGRVPEFLLSPQRAGG